MNNESSSVNETGHESEFEPGYHSILIIIAIVICVSNCLVIILFLTQASLRSSGNYFLFSLAISDIAVGVFGIPVNIRCELILSWPACLSSYSINRFIAVSTVYHILWITLEKYMAIIYPLQHKSQLDHTRVKITILCTWSGSLFVALVELIWLVDHEGPLTDFSDDVKRKELIHNFVIFVACFVLPVAVMLFAYTSIFLRILRQHSSIRGNHSQRRDGLLITTKRIPQKMKSALLFFTLLAVFIFCWFWWFSALFYTELPDDYPWPPEYVFQLLTALRYSTSFINPILYTFFKRDFRKALKKLTNRARLAPTRHQTSLMLACVSHGASQGGQNAAGASGSRRVRQDDATSSDL